ncbi:MAG: YraN family protein [Bacteroidia bacterium]
MAGTKNTGNWGEEQALDWLRRQGYIILATNWRYKQLEIDIIARDGGTMVFAEVKTRSGEAFGEPETAVSLKKQRFLISAANQYLTEHNINLEARFDVLSVTIVNNNPVVKHLPDAFYPIVK